MKPKKDFTMYSSHARQRFFQRTGGGNKILPQVLYQESVKLTNKVRYNYNQDIMLITGKNNKVITVLNCRNKNNKKIIVEPVTQKDYKGISLAIRNKKEKLDYITPKHIREDIKENRLFCIKEEGKIVCIGALVFDKKHNSYYVKRVLVLNKKNEGKGYAKALIRDLSKLEKKVCVTPYKDNKPMIKILTDLGFKFIKAFGEMFTLYQKNRESGVLAW